MICKLVGALYLALALRAVPASPDGSHRFVVAVPTFRGRQSMVLEAAQTWRRGVHTVVIMNGTVGVAERRIEPPVGVDKALEVW